MHSNYSGKSRSTGLVLSTQKLRKIIRQAIVESHSGHVDMTPEEEEEYYEDLIAQHEEMEDGRYEREDAMYRKMGESVRRLVRESSNMEKLEQIARSWLNDYNPSLDGDLSEFKQNYLMDVRRYPQSDADSAWRKVCKEEGWY